MNKSKILVEKDLPPLDTQFLKQSWRFVPKHLHALLNQQKKGKVGALLRKIKEKDSTYQESSLQIINKNKKKYLAPVRDLEQIMKHFQTKFQDTNFKIHNNETKTRKGKKRSATIRLRTSIENPFQKQDDLIENKITKLLQLPTIKRINSQAKRLKALSMEQSTKKSLLKQQILKKFDRYFSKEIDLIKKKQPSVNQMTQSEPVLRKARAKTSVD